MTYENLQIVTQNGIVFVTINREKALNALNQLTMDELYRFFTTDAPAMVDVKGIVLTGAGDKAFVAGADIKEFLALDRDKGSAMAQRGHDVFNAIERFPKPVVAAINGFALGGGCELAMACHLRIASEKARFGQPEVNLGIIPGYGGTQRLIRYVGRTKALELLMTADMISAGEALSLGLVNYVVPAGMEIEKAVELLEKIATKGPVAIAKIIACANAYFEPGVDGMAFEIKAFGDTTGTEDFREGASAFIEKRPAQFNGK